MSTKVWDVKGALTWPGVENGGEMGDASNNLSDNNGSDNANNDSEDTGFGVIPDTNTIATATTADANNETPLWYEEEEEGGDINPPDYHSTAVDSAQSQASSAPPLNASGHSNDDASTVSPQQASNKGYSTLWPSEPSESIGDESYGDRYVSTDYVRS